MKLTIYTLATDCDNGTTSQTFATEQERDSALLEWVGSNPEQWAASKLADDLHEYVQSKTGYMDTFSTDEQEIEVDIDQLITVNEAWFRCKREPGAFGSLYDPVDVITVMSTWSESEDESDGSHWFNPEDVEDSAAILAWCEQEGPGFEEQISKLVWENMPTRKEAFEALEAKNKKEREAAVA